MLLQSPEAKGKDATVNHRQLTCDVQSLIPTKPAGLKPTKEGEKAAGEERRRLCTAQLTALGIIKDLYHQDPCPSCGRPMQLESTYRCTTCQKLYHVRCMAKAADNHHLQKCFLCDFKSQSPEHRAQRAANSDLIEDVMGVCN